MASTPPATPEYLRAVLDAVPAPIFVVDADLRIVDSNRAGSDVAGTQQAPTLRRLCGEALHCLNARTGEGACGTTRFCPDCVVRNAVVSARDGNRVYRERADMTVEDPGGKRCNVYYLVTASPFVYDHDSLVLLILEDVTELVELRGILPICAGCKKIRRDDRYWEQVESYFLSHSDLRFTHGLCPDCIRELYPENCDEILRADGSS